MPEENGSSKKLKKSIPIGWRLALYVAGIGSFLCLSVVLCIMPFQQGRVEQEAITEAHILTEAVSAIYERLGENEPRDHARRLLLRVARTPYISLVNVQDKNGVVRYSTDSRELGKQYVIKYGVLRHNNEISVTHVTATTDAGIGSVTAVIDRDMMLVGARRLFAQIGIGLFAIILILSFLVKGLVEGLISARLSRLMHLIENAEQGSFLVRARVDRYDEIGHVIRGFNQLLGVITQIEARHLEKELSLQDAMVQKSMRIELEEVLEQLKRANEKLDRKAQAHDLLMEAAHRLGGTLNRDSIVERLIMLIQEKLKWIQFAVFLVDAKTKDKPSLHLAASFGIAEDILAPNARISYGEGVTGMVAQTGAPIIIGNIENEKNLKLWENQDRTAQGTLPRRNGSLMAVPMIHKGRVVGVMDFFHQQSNIFDAEDISLISALGAQAALAIINAELYETTLELATSDPLTGVMNRRAMVRQIQYELARSQRFHIKMALLLVDVDHFKSYNDRMGHVLGDMALKEIADALQKALRKVDTLARFGGEEFCVILPQTDLVAAKEVAQKLCESVRSLKLRGAEKQELGYLSVSIGIAIVPDDINKFDNEMAVNDIIAIADQALYEAKRMGRDRYIYLEQNKAG